MECKGEEKAPLSELCCVCVVYFVELWRMFLFQKRQNLVARLRRWFNVAAGSREQVAGIK